MQLNLTLQDILTIGLGIIALVSLVLTINYRKKYLKQLEINLNTRLLHEDRKKALSELYGMITDNFDNTFEIKNFLDSPESLYLPDVTRTRVVFFLDELKKYNKDDYYNLDKIKEREKYIEDGKRKIRGNIEDYLTNPNRD